MVRLLWVLSLLLLSNVALGSGWLQTSQPAASVLSVDQAFRVQPALWQAGRLIVGIDAAPGCYLYREKLRVEALEPPAYVLGKIDLPAGDRHHDENFGDVQVLRERVVGIYRPKASAPPRRIRIRYQGCAENLVCYAPQERVVDVEMVP